MKQLLLLAVILGIHSTLFSNEALIGKSVYLTRNFHYQQTPLKVLTTNYLYGKRRRIGRAFIITEIKDNSVFFKDERSSYRLFAQNRHSKVNRPMLGVVKNMADDSSLLKKEVVYMADLLGKIIHIERKSSRTIFYVSKHKMKKDKKNKGKKILPEVFNKIEIDFTNEGTPVLLLDNQIVKNQQSLEIRQNLTGTNIVNRYFSGQSPFNSDLFKNLTETEKELVLAAGIEKGMRKEAVLMSLGYPLASRTPSLKNDTWIYAVERRKLSVVFRDNRVVDLL